MKLTLGNFISDPGQANLRNIEDELELQKARLSAAMKLSTNELKKFLIPGSLTENMVAHFTREFPLSASALLFLGGALAAGIFEKDKRTVPK